MASPTVSSRPSGSTSGTKVPMAEISERHNMWLLAAQSRIELELERDKQRLAHIASDTDLTSLLQKQRDAEKHARTRYMDQVNLVSESLRLAAKGFSLSTSK